jgi:glycosyltransferase involved in cell wall biosynthesis
VEGELRAENVRAPLRTVRNGVAARRTDDHAFWREAMELRRSWGVENNAQGADRPIVVLIVANPRPQKRLDLAVDVVQHLALHSAVPVHVVWAGAASDVNETAKSIERAFLDGLRSRGIAYHALGAMPNLDAVYRACDVLLGTSEWEGLSLSHLEALATGLPIVVTDVGGTREIAQETPHGASLVAATASADEIAIKVAEVLRTQPVPIESQDHPEVAVPPRYRQSLLPPSLEVGAMVRSYARLLRQTARMEATRQHVGSTKGDGVVLVTNNFSPGGAQSSARRLLRALAERGHTVHAITLEEHASNPTPGTVALQASGIEVVRIPAGIDAAEAAERAAAFMATTRPRSVLFWNVIAEHKALLADLSWGCRIVDVSPGEMYFRSLARYFEKPRVDSSLRTPREYGSRLFGAVVKFAAEKAQAADVLQCPVHVIPNGVPIVKARAPKTANGGPFRFGTTVRIHPDKRLEILIDAIEQLCAKGHRVHLSVLGGPDAGCDSYMAELRERAKTLPIEWLGFSDDVGPFLGALDGFVLVAEPAGCPNASLEALGAGLPVVATDVGGMREQLDDGAGLLVPRNDPSALASAMADVVNRPNVREAMARAGQERIIRHFGLARMTDRYADVLGLGSKDGV